jgi:16S rRNA (guanine527-N7)-methyltransferase
VSRHIVDSLRAVPVLDDAEATADLGSGGGLPGIPVAIARPDVRVRLLDARHRRVGFLELVCARLGLENASPVRTRIEEATIEPWDACFARALAPLPRAWDLATRLLRPGGRLIYFAGADPDLAALAELDAPIRIVPPLAVARGGPLVIIVRP